MSFIMGQNTTPEEFVNWLKGYLDALPKDKIDFTVFDKIKEKLHYIKKED